MKKGFGWSEKYKYAKGRRLIKPALYGMADSFSTHSSGPQSTQLSPKVLKAALKDSNDRVWKTNENHFKCQFPTDNPYWFNSTPTHSTGPQSIQLGPKVLKGSLSAGRLRRMKKRGKRVGVGGLKSHSVWSSRMEKLKKTDWYFF